MRITSQLVVTLIALAVPVLAQQPAPAAASAAPVPTSSANQETSQKRHESAMKFLQMADARQRLEQVLGKLLDDGRKDLLQRNPGLDPRFADEWEKRMKLRVNLDDLVNATAQVYEKYFTRDELDQLTESQFALKKGQIHTLPAELGQKLKQDSPRIQRDINTQTSLIGARIGKEVGLEVEKDHPEWGKNTGPANTDPAKK